MGVVVCEIVYYDYSALRQNCACFPPDEYRRIGVLYKEDETMEENVRTTSTCFRC